MRKVNEYGLKRDYETDDALRGFIRCLAALSHVPVPEVENAYNTQLADMPADERVNDLVTYFKQTYVRGRRYQGTNNYAAAIFPIATWNQYDSAGEGIARTTNSCEGWHFSLQSLLMCHHPTMWRFLAGIERDCSMSKASYLQAATGAVNVTKKKYRTLKERVRRAVAGYGTTDTLTYLRAIAHLSHE
jgi:hypothetical protein